MSSATPITDSAQSAPSSVTQIHALEQQNAELSAQVAQLQSQLTVFKQMLFGKRSEKRSVVVPEQASLFDDDQPPVEQAQAEPKKQTITYERDQGKKGRSANCVSAEGLRFDSDVPVKRIRLTPDEIKGLSEDQYQIIGTDYRYRLAQQPASYTVLIYEIPKVKLNSSGAIVNAPPAAAVLERSLADVSFLGGLLVDKFAYHLPLYRQHQRLQAAGITVARSTLTHLVQRAIGLLDPIVQAQWEHVLSSNVIAMDETPIKAGRSKTKKGRMHQGYYWPIYGDSDEVVFTYSESRARRVIEQILGKDYEGVLLSDGYKAYASYAAQCEAITHAQCWTHTRRQFVKAYEDEPILVDEMLAMIGTLYGIEADIREQQLDVADKRQYRQRYSAPVLDKIINWVKEKLQEPYRLPKAPFTKALGYFREREAALRVFLDQPDVALDTNHLERALRPVPMGRRAWNFCWSEVGAEHVGLIQSLITTCKLHEVDPYTYLVDVLQRVGEHPSKDVIELTPRVWKTRFADNPLRSDLYDPV